MLFKVSGRSALAPLPLLLLRDAGRVAEEVVLVVAEGVEAQLIGVGRRGSLFHALPQRSSAL